MEARHLPHPAQRGWGRRRGTGTGTGPPATASGERGPASPAHRRRAAGMPWPAGVAAGPGRWQPAGPSPVLRYGLRWRRGGSYLPRQPLTPASSGVLHALGTHDHGDPVPCRAVPCAVPVTGAGPARPVPATGSTEPGTAAARAAGGVPAAPPPPITATRGRGRRCRAPNRPRRDGSPEHHVGRGGKLPVRQVPEPRPPRAGGGADVPAAGGRCGAGRPLPVCPGPRPLPRPRPRAARGGDGATLHRAPALPVLLARPRSRSEG